MSYLLRLPMLVLSLLAGITLAAEEDPVARGETIATQNGCSGCHTPPGGTPYSGFLLGGWMAYNITPDPAAGIGDWSDEELLTYFRTGHVNGKAQAAGPMAAIIMATSALSSADQQALVAYLRSLPPANPSGEQRSRSSYGAPADDVDALRGEPLIAQGDGSGKSLYLGSCASCHGPGGVGSRDGYYPSLVNNSAVGAAAPDNLINAILQGVSRTSGGQEYFMPGFADALSDDEVAALGSYVLARFGREGIVVTADAVAAKR
jgi:mono/diheme cytochrome c family protein